MLLLLLFKERKYKGGSIPRKRVQVLCMRMMVSPSSEGKYFSGGISHHLATGGANTASISNAKHKSVKVNKDRKVNLTSLYPFKVISAPSFAGTLRFKD